MKTRPLSWLLVALAGVQPAAAATAVQPTPPAPFTVAGKITLPGVKGRIDHLAFDARGKRLFIAELGNHSVSIIDVDGRRVLERLPNLPEPQGIAYFPRKQLLYVATGGDGMVRAFRSTDFTQVLACHVGDDADNVRVDMEAEQVYVGAGAGALVILDAESLTPFKSVALKGHPESFQFAPDDSRIFVNVPGAQEIAVVDRAQDAQTASWPLADARANYAMALDHASEQLLTVFRAPPRIGAYPLEGAAPPRSEPTCSDADDVFVDQRRQRVYVVCGQGVVAVHEAGTLRKLAEMPTAPGARTGFYSPDADELFIAAPARDGRDAAIWILTPAD